MAIHCAYEYSSALVLSGGGARGAYQVGVIKALSESISGPSPFPVISGVSVGAINAAVLAEGADDFPLAAQKLEHIWRSLSCARVFCTDPIPLFARFVKWGAALGLGFTGIQPPKSILDAHPLKKLLEKEIDYGRIAKMIEQHHLHALAVTASSYTTGESTTFFQGANPNESWARSRRKGIATEINAEHILASSALPGIFEAIKIDQQWYGDGALRQSAPLSPAIHLGCDRLLLMAVRDGLPNQEAKSRANDPYPSMAVLGGQMLDIIFNDNLDTDKERLERINATLSSMTEERRNKIELRSINTLMVRPSFDVRDIAGIHINKIPRSVKFILSALGGMRAPWVLPSYLTFEPAYIANLIDLGYSDAKIKMPDLLRFVLASSNLGEK